MGFFASAKKASKVGGTPSVELLHRLGCKACPLAKLENEHPDMEPTGSVKPVVYMLGEAPGREEDKYGEQFIGPSGQLIRSRIPDDWKRALRWNNVVRTRPYKNETPQRVEIECCRPSIERDIARTKPLAVFGFGQIPLNWATGMNGIGQWRGRRTPINVMGHVCWFYSFHHPSYLLRLRRRGATRPGDIGSEQERTFVFGLARAFAEVESLPKPKVWTEQEARANVEIIESSAHGLERVEVLLGWAAKQKRVGVDYETFRTRPYATDSQILSVGVGHPECSFSFPVDHPQANWTPNQRKKLDELWRRFLLSGVLKVSHFLNFEQEWSAVFYGADVLRAGPWGDSYNQAAVLDERQGDAKPGCLSLEFLVQLYFGFNLKKLSPLNRKDLRKEPLRDVLTYNAMDAKWHDMVFGVQDKLLKAEGLHSNYEADVRKIPAIVLTQIKGVPIYEPATRALIDKYTPRIEQAEAEIARLPEVAEFKRRFGREFKPSSNPDMGLMLTKIMHRAECLVEDKRTHEKKIVVDESVMARIDHPLTGWEMKRRKAQKILSTYVLPYTSDGFLWPDGRIHTILNQPGTVSNRTSADSPNIQNIPKRNEEAKEVRKQIRAPKGHVICSVDYGQIQFRGIAMTSRDKKLVEYLWSRHDVHTDWTNEIAYACPDRVGGKENLKAWGADGAMKKFRTDVKNQWTFPSVFGASLESRATYLKIPKEVLEPVDRRFWKEFGGIADWHDRQRGFYEKHNYVVSPNGRRFRGPLSPNQYINYPIQEIEADIVVGHGFCTLSERATRTGDLYFQPELEIHDDLTFILPVDKVDDYVEQIVTDMLKASYDYINVPLSVEVSVGKDLYSTREVLVAFSDEWKK